jgi:16S rRNA U1498 N3-methylase RsmE
VEARASFVADPRGEPGPAGRWQTPALIAIGPEGGWLERELDAFARCGLGPVAVGERAIRVETAVPVLLGRYL